MSCIDPSATSAPQPRITHEILPIFTIIFVSFFLIGAAWGLGAPYGGTPDENGHILRAAGTVNGGFLPTLTDQAQGTGAFQPVPRGLLIETCWVMRPKISAACVDRDPSADRTIVTAATPQGRYHPLYYVAVGWPMRFWSGWSALFLSRLIGAAMIAALLAAAATCAIRFSTSRVAVTGVLLGATPMALHLAGGINPNGLEIASTICLFAAVLPVVTRDIGLPRPLVHLAGFNAVLLPQLRALAPLWLAIGAVAIAILTPWHRLRELVRDAAVRWWTAGAAASVVASVVWTLKFRVYEIISTGHPYSVSGTLKVDVLGRYHTYLVDMIGSLSWSDTLIPAPAISIWLLMAGALGIAAAVGADRRHRWAMATITVLTFAVPSALQAAKGPETGVFMQARYLLPTLAGVLVLAAYTMDDLGLPPRVSRGITRAAIVFAIPLHLVALHAGIVRWAKGINPYPHLNPFGGAWHPIVGTLTPFLLMAVGVGSLMWFLWRVTGLLPTQPPQTAFVIPTNRDDLTDIGSLPLDRL